MKSVQIRSSSWSITSRNRTQYGALLFQFPFSTRLREDMDQEKLQIRTVFRQCYVFPESQRQRTRKLTISYHGPFVYPLKKSENF